MITKKDKLWLLLQDRLKNKLTEDFYFLYKGHGWSENYIVLYTTEKDYLLKMENDEKNIKLISEDGFYKNIIPISDIINPEMNFKEKILELNKNDN
jgi:hypothetical protein